MFATNCGFSFACLNVYHPVPHQSKSSTKGTNAERKWTNKEEEERASKQNAAKKQKTSD
jgi:hypothetical protein